MSREMKGLYTALVTPLTESTVDLDLFKELILRQKEAGSHGVVIAGSTGEGQVLREKEWGSLIECAASFRDSLDIMISCGASSTWQVIERSKQAEDLGASSLLISTPAYNRPPQEGLCRHFQKIAQASKLPIMLYNIPSRTGVNLEAKSLQELWACDNIQSIKESSGNWQQFIEIQSKLPKGKSVFCGDDPQALSFFAHGSQGLVSVLSNLFPKKILRIWELSREENWTAARELFFELKPLMDILSLAPNPIPVKWALSQLLRKDFGLRLPLCPLDSKHQNSVERALKLVSD